MYDSLAWTDSTNQGVYSPAIAGDGTIGVPEYWYTQAEPYYNTQGDEWISTSLPFYNAVENKGSSQNPYPQQPYNQTYSLYAISGVLTAPPAPVVQLNAPSVNYSTIWTNSGAVAIGNAVSVTDGESATLNSMTVTLTSPHAGDALSAAASGGVAVSAYNSTTGQLVLSGSASLAAYQTVLGTVTYNNSGGGLGVSSETITVVASDGTRSSNPATATVSLPIVHTVPAGLSPGESYRLAFVTDTARDATSTDPDIYNAFVTATANSSPLLAALGTTWSTIANIGGLNAYANTQTNPNPLLQGSYPVYNLAGQLIAPTNASLWTAPLTNPIDVTEAGLVQSGSVWTGIYYNNETDLDGAFGNNVNEDYQLGQYASATGLEAATDSTWLTDNEDVISNAHPFYAISGILTAPPALVAQLNAPSVNYSTSWANSGAVAIGNAVSVTDEESATLSSMTASLGGVYAGDVLYDNTSDTSISSSYNASTGVLTLAGTDTLAHYQQVLQSITYDNTAGGPGVASETVNIVASDGTNVSAPAVAMVNIEVPPVVQLNAPVANSATTWTNGGAVTIANPGNVSITDGASSYLTSLTASIVSLEPFDVLSADTSATAISSSYNAGTGVLTLSGIDTLAHYQQVLSSVKL